MTWTPAASRRFFLEIFLGESPVWDGCYWRFSRLLVIFGDSLGYWIIIAITDRLVV